MDFSEILAANQQLKRALPPPDTSIKVLSNITIDPISDLLEYALRSKGISTEVRIGDYDNIVQESSRCGDSKVVIIFWELLPILERLYQQGSVADPEFRAFEDQLTTDLLFVLDNLKAAPLILLNTFTAFLYTALELQDSALDRLCKRMNAKIEALSRRNVLIVDLHKIFSQVSLAASVDWRLYYLTRCLYSKTFLAAYVEHIQATLLALFGKTKKALIFDCDNTLWKGIVGEDGADRIEMSSDSPYGRVFRDVQSIALEMSRKGILVGLCTRNNPADIDEVLVCHPDMLLKDSIACKRVNWDDKPSNLRAIAQELNIGIDSLAFVDDSPHEVLAVQQALPEVECLQVPTSLFQYPAVFRAFLRQFTTLALSAEDAGRTEMYRMEAKRRDSANSYHSLDDFVKSLHLGVILHMRPVRFISRLAQLSQKTNQFNLTTIRYSQEEIAQFLESERTIVSGIEVEDRFGNYGLSGLAIVLLDEDLTTADISTLLLSCRVLGRQVEMVILDGLIRHLAAKNVGKIRARYLKTEKNKQVEEYYDRFGFKVVGINAGNKEYELDLQDYRPSEINYITVTYARAD